MRKWPEDFINKIICGDSEKILKELPKGHYRVITDPPYGVNFIGKKTKKGKYSSVGSYITGDDWKETKEKILRIIKICIEISESTIITPGIRNCFDYPKPEDIGSFFYPSGSGMGKWGFICSQPILYYGKDPYLSNKMGSRPNGIYTTELSPKVDHPCPKPIKSWEWLVKRGSLENEIVIDPFLGSGTTAMACKVLNRNFIGIEIDQKYCDIAQNRLKFVNRQIKNRLFVQKII